MKKRGERERKGGREEREGGGGRGVMLKKVLKHQLYDSCTDGEVKIYVCFMQTGIVLFGIASH